MPVYLPAIVQPEPGADLSLPAQVFAAISAAIRAGRLAEGDMMPSTRQAADGLGLSRSTISTAYDLLRAEGLITMRAGSRPVVCLPTPRKVKQAADTVPALSTRGHVLARDPRTSSYTIPQGRLSPGLPDEGRFPADLWGQILRRHARQSHGEEACYGGYHGARALRAALCARLASDRGLQVSSEQILITPGTQASLNLIAQTMLDPGMSVALENPGYLGARAAFQAAGAMIHPVPVDAGGLDPAQLPPEAKLIYITPSNQYPLGGRMDLTRRLALLERARAQGSLILEDDYDSEFLWHGREIASLAAHGSGEECVYLGSASKTLLPGLRLGWMVVPPALIAPLRAAHRNLGYAANLHGQLALAELMNSGHYRLHLRRISRLYQQRGLALHEALSSLPFLQVLPPRGGVQLGLRLLVAGREEACMTALAQTGYRVGRLSALCLDAATEGLVIGFATLRPDDPARIASTLAQVVMTGRP
ncbi:MULTISPECIES: PLP-dependent aminotransferase family protein [unclassified Asaia]|uniref:MocR-like pyridoxine biosynthesis transcription factor PdxR n=1 Tax=unclassified Asaia TaxID=2685023 RepID=UPI001315920D|nr:PLP-dependent aminotransferase family protein [Asaia sp. W19]